MSKYLFQDWRDEQRKVKYPFADTATMTNGVITFLNSLFIDGRLYPIGGGPRLYISKVAREVDVVTLTLRSEASEDLATASFQIASPPANGILVFSDQYDRPAGVLVSTASELAVFGTIDQGTYLFTVDQTEFVAAIVVPMPDAGVRGIITADGELVAGDVWLVGENGIVLRKDGDALRIDIVGDAFAKRALCVDEQEGEIAEDEGALVAYCPLLTINGYTPDDYGNFEMRVGGNQVQQPILRIEPGEDANSLKLQLLAQYNFKDL